MRLMPVPYVFHRLNRHRRADLPVLHQLFDQSEKFRIPQHVTYDHQPIVFDRSIQNFQYIARIRRDRLFKEQIVPQPHALDRMVFMLPVLRADKEHVRKFSL